MDKNSSREENFTGEYPICVRCKTPVIKNKANYETFERMHYFCFHIEYEHNGFGDFDIDEFCYVPGCPWQPANYTSTWDPKTGQLDPPDGPIPPVKRLS
jgi:hypothetical protein